MSYTWPYDLMDELNTNHTTHRRHMSHLLCDTGPPGYASQIESRYPVHNAQRVQQTPDNGVYCLVCHEAYAHEEPEGKAYYVCSRPACWEVKWCTRCEQKRVSKAPAFRAAWMRNARANAAAKKAEDDARRDDEREHQERMARSENIDRREREDREERMMRNRY
jgi:hypothetical protein